MARAQRAIELFLNLGMAATTALACSPQISAQPLSQDGHARHRQLAQDLEGGEGGEGGESGQPQPLSDDTDLLVVLAQMQGHLLVAEDLLQRGDPRGAEPHVGHPADELYGSLQPAIRSGRLPAFLGSLEALRQQVRLASTAPATATKLSQAQQAIEAASTAIAPRLPSQPSLVLTVTRQLARAAASEYDAAVADGRIVETIEYQDARGFLLQADRLLSQAIQAAGSAAGDLEPAQARIRAMLQAFPTSRPPARTRLGVDRIRALAEGF